MENMGQYMLSLIFTALICGILSSLVPSRSKPWLQLICGLVITITLVMPFLDAHSWDLAPMDDSIRHEGNLLTEEGQKIANDSMASIIRQNCQAYIMDKAAELGITADVQIAVSDDTIPIPIAAQLDGDVTPYAKLQLESVIERDLGITKENIRWIE